MLPDCNTYKDVYFGLSVDLRAHCALLFSSKLLSPVFVKKYSIELIYYPYTEGMNNRSSPYLTKK